MISADLKWVGAIVLTHLATFFIRKLINKRLKKMTTQANQPLTNAETIFKSLVWDPLVLAGEVALFTDVPFLDAPVIGTIDKELISLASNWLFSQLRLIADITAIKLLNSEHQSAYDSASMQLAVIAQEKGITSNEFIQARDAAKIAMSKFTRINQ